ncbi:tetratricopeptide repeat protein, partial [Pseudodesulfovibrio pelocollis]|uniref:tetratricopeptide repeat protein n=1 Tax=Pseudodesulfovibrio pelocollis TaxID=3051432 RepID=UPI00255AD3F0
MENGQQMLTCQRVASTVFQTRNKGKTMMGYFEIAYTWVAENKEWFFSGAGAIFVGGMITRLFRRNTPGTVTARDQITAKGATDSAIGNHASVDKSVTTIPITNPSGSVIAAPAGTVNQTTTHYHGVPPEEYAALATKHGITQGALITFLAIFEKEDIPLSDYDHELRCIAERFKELEARLERFETDDAAVATAKHQAREALTEGQLDRAEELLLKAMSLQLKKADTAALEAGETLAELAALENLRFAFAKAADYYLQAAERVATADSHQSMLYRHEAGKAFRMAGLFEEATEQWERCLHYCESMTPPDEAMIATACNNIAVIYEEQQRFDEAERHFKKALDIRERVFGKAHHKVASTCNNLAPLYETQQRFVEAEALYKRALDIQAHVFGKDHNEVASTCNNLANLYATQQRFDEAEGLYKKALDIKERVFGKDHHEVASTDNNLANLYATQQRFDEAEGLYQKALDIRERVFGKDHHEVAATCNNLAALYATQQRFDEAEKLYRMALDIKERVFGKEHREVAATCNNLALLYATQQRFDEAEELYRRALDIRERVLGKDHHEVAATCNNLALLYATQQRFDEAEGLYRRALDIRERVLGKDHHEVAATCNNLAGLYYQQQRFDEVEGLFQRALV